MTDIYNIDTIYMDCMYVAIRKGNLNAIVALHNIYDLDLNDKSSYDEYFGTCLHVAVRYNEDRPDIIETLIHLGVNVNDTDYYGVSALYNAIDMYGSSIDTIKMLLKYGADIYKYGYISGGDQYESPLELALRKGNTEAYKAMIPYTKGHKKWLRVRAIIRACCLLKKQYIQSVHNVWRPKGVGYHIAKAHFQYISCKC